MADFVFTSPGVKFKERDLTYVTRNVGITTLGLAGETLKGPAFEPVFIQDAGQFTDRFGAQSTKRFQNAEKTLQYQLPYVANAFLAEAQQLWVTRILGLSGYQAGTSWNITLDAGVDESTAVVGGSPVETTGIGFSGSTYLGVALSFSRATGSLSTGYTKNGSVFTEVVHEFTATTYNAGVGEVTDKVTTYTATSYTEYENMVLAVIRSRGNSTTPIDSVPVIDFQITELKITGNTTSGILNPTGDLYADFSLVANNPNTNTSSAYSGTSALYKASLDPNSASFLPNVIGNKPKDKNTAIWVQAIYSDLIRKLDDDGIAYGIKTQMVTGGSYNGNDVFSDYKIGFQTPETPWVVSQLKGNSVDRLFKFISITDGNSANQEIKISIGNIDPYTGEFDVSVRNFYDTDANPIVIETHTNCSMLKGANNYVGRRIGTSDGEYILNSDYFMVEMADEIPLGVYPAGFEGYMFNNYSSGVTGEDAEDFSKSKGFHLDSGATTVTIDGNENYFEVGAGDFGAVSDIDTTNPYYNSKKRKYTVVHAAGFEGWEVLRRERSYDDMYVQGGRQSGHPGEPLIVPTNDFQAWEMGIETFANPESVTINLFSTPGINWAYQTTLIQNTIDMIENQRTDTLYVIDAPQGDVATYNGDNGKADINAADNVAGLLSDTNIDSSYACTYYPWIQMRDTQNNVNVYIPPTGEVVRAMAFTDNISFPWFAPAGLNRGVTNARKSQFKLSLDARDILYTGRINPMADFADSGTAIFGQKTLQEKRSALDRINVRRLLLQIKVLISNIAVRLLFEQNDQATIDQFLNKANPVLDSIKRERGLTDFRVTMDNTNNTPESKDRNELYGEIFLKPTRAVEFIGITFTITPSGASFDDVG
jgi:hypothetical protein